MSAVAAQNIHSQCMEGGYREAFAWIGLKQRAHAFLHFTCSLVREGDSRNTLCRNPRVDQMHNLVGDNSGLAASGTCEYQEWAIPMADRRALLGIQAGHGRGDLHAHEILLTVPLK
jgi:hypothetical protein